MNETFYSNLFNKEITDLTKFDFIQSELKILPQSNFSQIQTNAKYKCSFKPGNVTSKICIIIPSRNNGELLQFTLKNLFENKINELCNIFVIDDRSNEDYSKLLENFENVFLARVDTANGFSYSTLCNTGAFLAYKLNFKKIIFWNNDLWVESKNYLEQLIFQAENDNATIAGSKLLYPKISVNSSDDSENIKKYFPDMIDGRWRGTVQFGGDAWLRFDRTPLVLSPVHNKRFSNKENIFVNCNRPASFVTGALQLIDLHWFIINGGFNCSLKKQFQDVDLCLRALQQNKIVMYYGKDIFFWHDESLSFEKEKENKNDSQTISDHFLFAKIWNEKLAKMLFY